MIVFSEEVLGFNILGAFGTETWPFLANERVIILS
jgi:hypothetical protein